MQQGQVVNLQGQEMVEAKAKAEVAKAQATRPEAIRAAVNALRKIEKSHIQLMENTNTIL